MWFFFLYLFSFLKPHLQQNQHHTSRRMLFCTVTLAAGIGLALPHTHSRGIIASPYRWLHCRPEDALQPGRKLIADSWRVSEWLQMESVKVSITDYLPYMPKGDHTKSRCDTLTGVRSAPLFVVSCMQSSRRFPFQGLQPKCSFCQCVDGAKRPPPSKAYTLLSAAKGFLLFAERRQEAHLALTQQRAVLSPSGID